MNNDDFEKKLNDIFKQNVDIPSDVTNTIKNFNPKENEKNWRIGNMKKLVMVAVCILIIGTTAVFAKTIIQNILNSNNGAINKALEYDYVQNIEMDYISTSEVSSKIESIVIDDSNLIIVFDHIFTKKVNKFDDILLSDLSITDDQGNILFEDGNLNSLSTGYEKKYATEDNLNIKQAIFFHTTQANYPKSKKLYINFPEIRIFNNSKLTNTFKGDWTYEVDIMEEFINRKSVNYIASESDDVIIKSAVLTPTGLDVEMQFENPIDAMDLKMKLIDDEGKEYNTAGRLSAEDEATKPIIKTSFEASVFNAQNHYRLIINAEKEIIIDLNLSEE